MISLSFNFARFVAIVRKEFIQMRRDRLTFAMMFGIPILQLVLFGFAINSDPKNLPVAVLASDNSPFARRFVHALENSGYFKVVDHVRNRGRSPAPPGPGRSSVRSQSAVGLLAPAGPRRPTGNTRPG